MEDIVFETKGLSYAYQNSKKMSLEDVSLRIDRNKKTVLLGANGAGKSTLFYHFNGVFKPKTGVVLYNGKPLDYNRKCLISIRSDVAVVLQNPDDQIFSATVEEDVAFGPLNMGLDRDEVGRRIEESLFMVGMEEFRHKSTQQLSYGQRKRISFAGALAMHPKVLILDEPTAGLDPQMSQELMELAEQMHHNGTAVIISTHNVDLAYSWADEIHVLRGGKLVYSGPSEEFYSDRVNVHLAGLMEPSIYSVNRNLNTIRGVTDDTYPRKMTQLVSKISSCENNTGDLILVPIGYGTEILNSITGDQENVLVGVYGIKSRKFAYENKSHVDFVFDGLECCLMETISGKDSILYCDEDLIDIVSDRVSKLSTFGSNVHIRILQN